MKTKLTSLKFYLVLFILFSGTTSLFAQEEEEEHLKINEKERSYINYDFLSWGTWGFLSFLNDASDDASTLGFELTSNINVGSIDIKNITYFELNRYSRSIPGRPIGNPNFSVEGANGIGDIMTGFWFSKKKEHHGQHHFAPGFALQLPTAADPTLGSQKFSMGPSFDYEYESKNKKLVAGAIFIQFWSIGGSSEVKDVNMLLVKPFLYYNIARNWDLMYIPYGVTVYWNKPSGQNVYVPLGGGIRKVFNIGKETDMNLSAQFFNNVIRPDKGTVNELRFLLEFVF